jgi:hypothetical protein
MKNFSRFNRVILGGALILMTVTLAACNRPASTDTSNEAVNAAINAQTNSS